MPILLLRQDSTTSLSTIVDKARRQSCHPSYEYDLQIVNNQLELLLLSKPVLTSENVSKNVNFSADEGFESDIDTISLISSENESFTSEKTLIKESVKTILTETDSANGGSGSDSETDSEKTNTLTQKNVNDIKETFEKQLTLNNSVAKTKECYSLLDCVCYADVNYPDILIFVIKHEAFVFRFEDLRELKTFYTNFSTLKAIANQRSYGNTSNKTTEFNKNLPQKFNLLQRTDSDGVTHLEVTKSQQEKLTFPDLSKNEFKESPKSRQKDVNLRQRAESKLLINDVKFNTISSKIIGKQSLVRANSIEDILSVNRNENNLVNDVNGSGLLRKVWNSAEDLLACEMPKRPERRKKKKPAPPPPQKPLEDVFSGQFVRVNVNVEALKDSSNNRLVIKSSANEAHPKKLQKSNNLSAKNTLTSFLKPQPKPSLLNMTYKDEKLNTGHGFIDNRLTKMYEKNSSWTSSVPRLLKKTYRSKSETRNGQFPPMAYRYIDTTLDYPLAAYPGAQNNAHFLTATGLMKPKVQNYENMYKASSKSSPETSRINFGYKNIQRPLDSSIGNRLFGLSPKLKDFPSSADVNTNSINRRSKNKWGSMSELNFFNSDKDKCNLKSVIKNNVEIGSGKKKNDKKEKKVTFSAYTTVQVV